MNRPKKATRIACAVALICCILLAATNVVHYMQDEDLITAASRGDVALVDSLLNLHADVNAHDMNDGTTPLMGAVDSGNSGIADMLLAHGASVDARDSFGQSALFHAAESGSTQATDLLIKHGAAINARDKRGRTPLMWAAAKNRPDVVQDLIARGADVAAQDDRSRTAMDFALFNHSRESMDVLHRAGVSPTFTP